MTMSKADRSTRNGSSALGRIQRQAQPQASTSKGGIPKGRGSSKKRGGSAEVSQPVVRRSMISFNEVAQLLPRLGNNQLRMLEGMISAVLRTHGLQPSSNVGSAPTYAEVASKTRPMQGLGGGPSVSKQTRGKRRPMAASSSKKPETGPSKAPLKVGNKDGIPKSSKPKDTTKGRKQESRI